MDEQIMLLIVYLLLIFLFLHHFDLNLTNILSFFEDDFLKKRSKVLTDFFDINVKRQRIKISKFYYTLNKVFVIKFLNFFCYTC
jgi:hypothetical protein